LAETYAPASLAAWAAWLAVLAGVVRRGDLRPLVDPARLQRWMAATVLLAVLWRLRVEALPALELRLLGATGMSLVFGTGPALVSLSAVAVVYAGLGLTPVSALPWQALTHIAVPVATAVLVRHTVERRCAANLFVYLFASAFFAAGASMLACGAATAAALALHGAWPKALPVADLAGAFLLLAWGEALLTGMLVTIFVVYRPGWVWTFDDRRYLAPPS